MSRLQAILDHTRAGLPAISSRRGELERRVASQPAAPDLVGALRRPNVSLIAEVKRRSPSAGAINPGLDPIHRAQAYAAGGAAVISVLTDEKFFGGSLEDLTRVAAAVDLPVLRKDFILDETQLLEARACGAAAALLIVRALEQPRLAALVRYAFGIGLTPLVEVHTADEVARAIDAGATVVGVNARDLDTFTIGVDAAWQLLSIIPGACIAVAESGMANVDDVERAAASGADAVLIGTALAAASSPGELVRSLSGVTRRGR